LSDEEPPHALLRSFGDELMPFVGDPASLG
jgi:hypothetical protein